MKRILLIGGAGFVGNNLARTLLNEGHSVAIFDDFSTSKVSNLEDIKNKLDIKKGDVRDRESIRNFIFEIKPDVIYFLAALHYIPDCNKDPQKARDINVEGARHSAQAAAELEKKPRFIHISTSSVYKPSNEPIEETYPTEPFEVYGKTKLAGEDVVRSECGRRGIDFFIIRPFSIYGPFVGIPQIIPEIVSQLKTGSNKVVLGNLDPYRDFIYVTDVAEALALFVDRGVSGAIYNIGGNSMSTIKNITEIISELLQQIGREVEFVSDPARFRGDLERARLVGNDNKIIKDLGWRPKIELREGIGLTLRAEGLLG